MLRKFGKHYNIRTIQFRGELILILLILFTIFAFGSITFPRIAQGGFLGLCVAFIMYLLGPITGFLLYLFRAFIAIMSEVVHNPTLNKGMQNPKLNQNAIFAWNESFLLILLTYFLIYLI